MKASELRIGDYVYAYSMNHKQKNVDTIAVIKQYGWETVRGFCAIEPIPLTEEWLVKFGFDFLGEDSSGVYRYDLATFQLWRRRRTSVFCSYNTEYQGVFGGLRLHYVHQLQNLYFALTGEELTINDKSCL